MKNIYLMFLLAVVVGCSKEKIREKQEDLVIQAMTNGQWKVSGYSKGTSDITSQFSTYKFQFKTDFTVDAINNGSVEKTGSWTADANTQTITSNFIAAVDPLAFLNGTWTITSTTWTSVIATQTVGGEVRTLHLDKL